MQSILFSFTKPVKLNEHFEIPVDETNWETKNYTKVLSKTDKPEGQTPSRERATFSTLTNGMVPKTSFAHKLKNSFGIYILFFEEDQGFYVGIASSQAKKPEGILSRIRKHRVKATGSNIGINKFSVGGVNHTKGWRMFAVTRAASFHRRGLKDHLQDAQLTIACSEGGKKLLEFVENYLTYKCNPVSNKLLEYIFPSVDPSRINRINRGKSNRDFKGVIEFNFWDGKQFEINIPLDT